MTLNSVLVTGGSGFIGAALVRRLLADGLKVRVLDNLWRGRADRLADVSSEIEFIKGDIRDTETVEWAVKGMDGIFHLAAINGTEFFYSKSELVLEVGVKGTINVLDACRKLGIGELIVASSSEVYQTPSRIPTDETVPLVVPDVMNPRYSYGGAKIISELLTVNYGRTGFERVMIFRPHNVYGPDMGWEHVLPQFMLRMKKLTEAGADDPVSFPIQGSGEESRAFVFIEDFVDGLMLMYKAGEHLGVYHIGSREEITIADAARQVGAFYRRNVAVVPSDAPAGGTFRRCPDITKIEALGYAPKVPFADGLLILARWYDENAHMAREADASQ